MEAALGPLPPGVPRAPGPHASMQPGAAWELTAAPAHPDSLAASPASGAPDAARAGTGGACAEPERRTPAGSCVHLAGPAGREGAAGAGAGAGPGGAPGARPRLAPRQAPLPSWAEALSPLGAELARLDRAAADLILRLLAYDPARRGPRGVRRNPVRGAGCEAGSQFAAAAEQLACER
jgi:hypothetical protein